MRSYPALHLKIPKSFEDLVLCVRGMALSVASRCSQLELNFASADSAESIMSSNTTNGANNGAEHGSDVAEAFANSQNLDSKHTVEVTNAAISETSSSRQRYRSSSVTSSHSSSSIVFGTSSHSNLLDDSDEDEKEENDDVRLNPTAAAAAASSHRDSLPRVPPRNKTPQKFALHDSATSVVSCKTDDNTVPRGSQTLDTMPKVPVRGVSMEAEQLSQHSNETQSQHGSKNVKNNSQQNDIPPGSYDSMPKQPVRGSTLDSKSLQTLTAEAIVQEQAAVMLDMPKMPVRGASLESEAIQKNSTRITGTIQPPTMERGISFEMEQLQNSSSADVKAGGTDNNNNNSNSSFPSVWEDSWTTFCTTDQQKVILEGTIEEDEDDLQSGDDDDDEDIGFMPSPKDFMTTMEYEDTASSFAERGGDDFGLKDDASADARKIFAGMKAPNFPKKLSPQRIPRRHSKTRSVPPVIVAAEKSKKRNDGDGSSSVEGMEDISGLDISGNDLSGVEGASSFAERGGGDFGVDDASFDAIKIFEGMKASPGNTAKRKFSNKNKEVNYSRRVPPIIVAEDIEDRGDDDASTYEEALEDTTDYDAASFAEHGGNDFGFDDASLDARKIFKGMKAPRRKKASASDGSRVVSPMVGKTSDHGEDHYSSYSEEMEELSDNELDSFAERGGGDFGSDDASLDAQKIFSGMKTPLNKRRSKRSISRSSRRRPTTQRRKVMMGAGDDVDIAERDGDDIWCGDFGEDDLSDDVKAIFGDMKFPAKKKRSKRSGTPTLKSSRSSSKSPPKFQSPSVELPQPLLSRANSACAPRQEAPTAPGKLARTYSAGTPSQSNEMRRANRDQRIRGLMSKGRFQVPVETSISNAETIITPPQQYYVDATDGKSAAESSLDFLEIQRQAGKTPEDGTNQRLVEPKDNGPKDPRYTFTSSVSGTAIASDYQASAEGAFVEFPPFHEGNISSLTDSTWLMHSSTLEEIKHGDQIPTRPCRQKSLQKKLELQRIEAWLKSTSSFTTDDLPSATCCQALISPSSMAVVHADESPSKPKRQISLEPVVAKLLMASMQANGQNSGSNLTERDLDHPVTRRGHRRIMSDVTSNRFPRNKDFDRNILSPAAKALQQSQNLVNSLQLLLDFGADELDYADAKETESPAFAKMSLASETTVLKASGGNELQQSRTLPARHFTRGKSLQSAAASLHHGDGIQ